MPAAQGLDVRALAEDRQGLVWVGHSAGLLRLDGNQARPLPVAASPVPVRALLLQGDDLLIAHGGGLSRWQRRDESLAVLPCPAQPLGYRTLQATPQGVYAFGSTLARLDPDGVRCEAVPFAGPATAGRPGGHAGALDFRPRGGRAVGRHAPPRAVSPARRRQRGGSLVAR
ncbi:MAG: hypothetical protein MUE46_16380 [Xanthomonadales bacterium]|nr:hypothetical protein [Xanthomonadales bacterium]